MSQQTWEESAVQAVIDNFQVLEIQQDGLSTWLVAQANTGTRYEVITLKSPTSESVLVSVLRPWNTCNEMGTHGYLFDTYVSEKLNPNKSPEDLAAVTIAIGKCLHRPVVVSGIQVNPEGA